MQKPACSSPLKGAVCMCVGDQTSSTAHLCRTFCTYLREMFMKRSRGEGDGVGRVSKKARRTTGEEMSLLLLPAGYYCGREVIPF